MSKACQNLSLLFGTVRCLKSIPCSWLIQINCGYILPPIHSVPLKTLGKPRAWLSLHSNSPSLLRVAACARAVFSVKRGLLHSDYLGALLQQYQMSEKSDVLWLQKSFSSAPFPAYQTSDQWLHFLSDYTSSQVVCSELQTVWTISG